MTDTQQRLRVIDDKSAVSARISDLCRLVGAGLMLLAYVDHLTSIGLLGAGVIIVDYLQSMCGYILAEQALRNENYMYVRSSVFMRIRYWLFYIKQILAVIGSLVAAFVHLRMA